MENNPQVLIVGAGPTGLMMACQLAIFGIPFRILEKSSGPTTQSRAVAVQARTMEIFEQMEIAKRAITEGQPAKAVNYIVGKTNRRIPIEHIGEGLSPFPYLLMLEQSKTERLLIDFLKKYDKRVEWSTVVSSFTQDTTGVTAVLTDNEGKEERITVSYIIGADGAHSIVRHTIGIPLAGATYHQVLFVLDCHVTSPLFKKDEVYLSLSHSTFTAFFPLKKGGWRIIGVLPEELIAKDIVTFEDIQKHFSERVTIPVSLSLPHWISTYHSHHRCVKQFRIGRCFLAGDAAHIHSPVGAQGMNTGLQDAYNLAWKLAFVLQKKAKPSLLDTYNQERLPFAKKLVATTDRVFTLVVNKNVITALFTKYLAPLFMQIAVRNPVLKKFIFTTISQIGISYKKTSILSHNASYGIFPKQAPLPGDRLPYLLFTNEKGEKKNIQMYIKPTKIHILAFIGNSKENLHKISSIVEEYKDVIHITTIPYLSSTRNLYKKFGIKTDGYYIVRPDMYIAYRSQGNNAAHVRSYLSQFLIR